MRGEARRGAVTVTTRLFRNVATRRFDARNRMRLAINDRSIHEDRARPWRNPSPFARESASIVARHRILVDNILSSLLYYV